MKRLSVTITASLVLVVLLLLLSQTDTAGQAITVCIRCHSVLTEPLSNPVKLWQTSIHAEHGISCNACHGGDPMDSVQAMSSARGYRGIPAPTAVATLCGGCHSEIARYFMRSEHGRAAGRGGPTCVTCHGSHGITRTSPDLIGNKHCSKCHTFEKARLIRSVMLKRDTMLMAIEQNIKQLKSKGNDTGRMEMRFFSLRNRFHAVFHSFDIELIIKESEQIQAELANINGSDGLGSGTTAGIIGVGGLLIGVLMFYLFRRT